MIGYPITLKDLRKRIDDFDPKWRAKAAAETKALKHGDKVEKALWSEIKPVYMRLQHGKCAFCEKLLGEQIEFDLISQDVEHFRPKNAIEAWPSQKLRDKLKLPADIPASAFTAKGYTFLAYHELNYAAACKTCNSTLKANYFPTKKAPKPKGKDPIKLTTAEEPYLVYPISDFDDQPEDIVTFLGIVPVPAHSRARRSRHERARVNIAFFALSTREDLMKERAMRLDQMGDKLQIRALASNDIEIAKLNKEIDRLCMPDLPHTNCSRAFKRLWDSNPVKAKQMLDVVKAYLATTNDKT